MPEANTAVLPLDGRFRIEHPRGQIEVPVERDASGAVTGAGLLRTARKLRERRGFPAPDA
jgi:4-oxalomesaconate tautomerase